MGTLVFLHQVENNYSSTDDAVIDEAIDPIADDS